LILNILCCFIRDWFDYGELQVFFVIYVPYILASPLFLMNLNVVDLK